MTNQEFLESISEVGEVWRDVVGYEGRYMVSNLGRVYSFHSNKIIIPSKNLKGYLFVRFGRKAKFYVHRLVYDTFVGYTDKNQITNHINSIKDDNRLVNLEACDYSYNSKYAYQNGEHKLKPVVQYNLKGEYICTYRTAKEASEKTGVLRSGICSCCKGKNQSAGGFLWAYEGDKPKEYNPYSDSEVKVVQLNLDGSFIKIWDSLTDASAITHRSNICRCCKGGYRSAGGYRWMYLSDYENLLSTMSRNSKE